MKTQNCPSCARAHDVSGLAEGHELACACGARFAVRALESPTEPGTEATMVRSSLRPAPASPADGVDATRVRPSHAPAGSTPMGSTPAAMMTGPGDENTYVSTGLELPGFEMVRVLGRGGMGEVWLARQRSLGRMVAVKVLPPRLAKDAEFVTRFEKEATALAALSHPNIIQIIDRGVAGEHYYFVMEYVEGRSLRDVIRELSPPEALRVALQVARAIECAHDKDIIHRDLKPENILLDGRGHVKVADFGLAGIRREDSRLQLTATAVAMGTLNYMAPEQRRDAKNVDGRADLFSFGVMLYEMLTGELPVGRFKLPSERVPGLDSRVDAVVARLLENEPEARYARAAEVCHALEELVTSISQPALPARTQEKKPGKVRGGLMKLVWRRVRTPLAVLGGVMLMFAGARKVLGPVTLFQVGDTKWVLGSWAPRPMPADGSWPANTDGELMVATTEETLADGRVRLGVDFVEGEEELNAHAGTWQLVNGQLHAEQGGDDASGAQLMPRTFLAHRYFSSDDFSAEVVMRVESLGKGYSKVPEDAQQYAELSFRAPNMHVSVYAIPKVGMRLGWRYTTADGEDVAGNSAQEVDNLLQDEAPVPQGAFRVKLQMKRKKNGVEVQAYLNNNEEPFAHKFLEGFQGRSAKVALGCRNQACTFDDLAVRGVQTKQAHNKVAETQQE